MRTPFFARCIILVAILCLQTESWLVRSFQGLELMELIALSCVNQLLAALIK